VRSTIMYRQMAPQACCVSCGDARPSSQMEYAPHGGGLWCWRCKMTAQIAQHGCNPAEQRAETRRFLAIAISIVVTVWVVGFALAGFFIRSC